MNIIVRTFAITYGFVAECLLLNDAYNIGYSKYKNNELDNSNQIYTEIQRKLPQNTSNYLLWPFPEKYRNKLTNTYIIGVLTTLMYPINTISAKLITYGITRSN